MEMINQGKMYIRRINEMSAILGVIAVPVNFVPEKIYMAILSDKLGMTIMNIPRDCEVDFRESLDLLDMDSIMHYEVFKDHKTPNVLDVFLRDTDIPNAPAGFKWVLAAGPSKHHDGNTRMINIEGDRIYAVEGEICQGESIDGVARMPIWGNQEEPYNIATTIVYDSLHNITSCNNDPLFISFKEKIEALSPAKSHYTGAEIVARDLIANDVMNEILSEEKQIKNKLNKL